MRNAIEESITIRQAMLSDDGLLKAFDTAVDRIVQCFRSGGKLLLCGNGGSAADAQHIAAELSGRFKMDRKPLFAEALHVNTSFLTSVANDYGYDEVFARMVSAMARPGDIVIGLSTSGNSENVVRALKVAKELECTTIALLGETDGKMGAMVDLALNVPSRDTARIQELHITIGHAICESVEKQMFL